MSVTVAKASKHYKKFYGSAVNICKDKDLAKDLVQEMFIKLIAIEEKEGSLDRLSYKGEINFYFCYRILYSIYLNTKILSNSYGVDVFYCDVEEEFNSRLTDNPDKVADAEREFNEAVSEITDHIEAIIKKEHWFDVALFKEYISGNKSMRELADEIGISAATISNSVNKVKQSIKSKADYGKIENYYQKKNQAEEGGEA